MSEILSSVRCRRGPELDYEEPGILAENNEVLFSVSAS